MRAYLLYNSEKNLKGKECTMNAGMDFDTELIKQITAAVFKCIDEMADIEVGVSNKHVHLSREHMDILFGKGSELSVKKMVGQPGQFAANEQVKVIGPKGSFEKVRILGPLRKETQVEISKTDSYALGVKAPLRDSGKLEGTPGVTLVGPCGTVELDRGVIIAKRHIHLTPTIAKFLNTHDGQVVSVDIPGDRGAVMKEVTVRVTETSAPEMHIDTDEANALGIKNGDKIRFHV